MNGNIINTIFYFVNDFDTYQLKVLQHEISAKTIVFVEDLLAIYKDGKRYGNMGYDDIKDKVIEIVTNDEDGKRAAGDAYDDSGLIDALDRIDSITRAEQERLSNLIQQLDTEIQERVNTMFKDAQWIRENVAQNEYLHQDMTWIGDEINAYLLQVGYWTTDSNGNTITQWSKIQQSVDSISTNVNALSQNVDGRFTAVQSAINQSVDLKIQTAKTEISNMYASGQDVNGVKQVVEWMYSGLKSSAGPDQSVAEIISAGKNSLVGAISDMRTLVNKLKNGDYVATASLETQVLNIIDGTLSHSGFVTQSDLSSSMATVSAMLRNPALNIEGWSTMYNLVNTINGLINNALAGLVTRISTLESNVLTLSQAGFVTQSDVNSSIATAFANYEGSSSSGGSGSSNAALELRVTDLESASTSLTSRVSTLEGNVLTLSQAGFTTQSLVNDAITRAFANYSTSEGSGDSSLELRVYALENAGFMSEGDLVSAITDRKNDIILSAGLATSAQIDGLSNIYLAKTDLVSEITSKKNDIISNAGLATAAQISNLDNIYLAKTDLVSAITDNKNAIITNAGLATKAQYDALGNTYLAKADLVTEITNKAGLISTSAGLMLSSGLDTAVADLVANTSSTRAAIQVIATDNQSSITVNADDINMTANHKLSLNSDYLNIASNFYSTVANNITLTADKITIDAQHQLDLTSQAISVNANNVVIDAQHQLNLGSLDLSGLTINANQINIDAQHQLDLTSLNLSIAGDQITMSSSHPLALDTTGVTVNGQPFFNAISNELNVDSVVTNKLTSGTGTFKGNVEATSFTAGGQGLTGIVVMSGAFDPISADTAKMYFAYDPSQNAPNLYIYDSTPDTNNNNNPVGWRCLSFANALTTNEYFASPGWYVYTGNLDGYIKDTDTTLSAADFTPVTLYAGHDDNRYYTYDSTSTPAYTYAGGYYYKDCYDSTVPTPKDSSNNTLSWYDTSQDIIYDPNSDKSGGWIPMLLILEEDGSTGKYIAAEIHSLNAIIGDNGPTYIQNGIITTSPGSGIATRVWYSNDAILSYTKDSDGHITNIVRGFSFVKPAIADTFGFSDPSIKWWMTGDDLISIIVDKQNRGWHTSHLVLTSTEVSGSSLTTTYDYPSCVVKANNAGDKNASYENVQAAQPVTGVTGTNASVYSLW